MSAQYNVSMQLSAHNGDEYGMDDGYPHDGVTPPGMGWDGQSDGGGKFRLKRRRRCGQCGPCQVKENCSKCQYCMRKDVLKQACVYRKCVYLRKPVPRFRQEPTSAGSVAHKSAPTPPHKPTSTPVPSIPVSSVNSSSNSTAPNSGTASNSNNSSTPLSNPGVSSPTAVGAPISHAAELSSCRLTQSPFATMSAMQSMNNGVLDPLRHRMMETPHRSLFESMNHHPSLDPSRSGLDSSKAVMADMSRFTGGPAAPILSSHCKQDQASTIVSQTTNMGTAAAASLNSVNSALSGHHPHHQPSKCPPSLPPRDPCFPTMDTWSSMPYALPHSSAWATPALPSHHVAAATYGFPQHSASFPSTFSPSSCQLGMPDPTASRFVPPTGPQHSFHHSMTMAGFSQDFAHAASNHSSHANIRTPMSPPFYPPPPHISPSSIHSFPGLGQFSASQASFGPAAYSMHPHAHMYPSSFYSFRAASEPQIYHVQVYPSHNPFKHCLQQIPMISQREKKLGIKDTNSEFDFSREKDFGCDILERRYLDICSSDKNLINSFEKDFLLPNSLDTVKVLTADYLKCKFSEGSRTKISCSPCDLDSTKDKHQLLDDSEENKLVSCAQNNNKANTVHGSSCFDNNVVTESDEDSSVNNVVKDDDDSRGCTEPFHEPGNIDQDLEDHLTWVYPSLVCSDFPCEDDEFMLTGYERTMEMGSDITTGDDGDNDDSSVKCSQLEKRKPVSLVLNTGLPSVLYSPCKKIRSVAPPQTNLSAAFLLPDILSSSSLLPSAVEARDVCSYEERQHDYAHESDHLQSSFMLSNACHENLVECLHLNVQTKAQRNCKRKQPFLKVRNKSPRGGRTVHLHRSHQKSPQKKDQSSHQSILDLSETAPSYVPEAGPSSKPSDVVSPEAAPSSKQSVVDSAERAPSSQQFVLE